ncbi:general transcription factor IIIA, b [Corythoichthys intestinalis]|uniref:general transcription factor IIIA, b n=1 Tax=Corythoichthys intestinalis TaxID=161448 RepID=UPI0025A618A9|nr:general transcription factor IIIA, b [Corythoichthys intestinalis]XP_061810159.1 general transcription factor IIIA, b [Nerophis lumbriciformis]
MGERLQGSKTFVCLFFDCKAKFSKSWKLEAHLCKHTGFKPFPCENCDKRFCTRYELTRHELNHSGERLHRCPTDDCSEAFVRHSSLKKHVARAHQHKERRYQCTHEDCQASFRKKYQLKAHIGEHQGTLPFCCHVDGCVSEFPSLGKLKHHENMHKGYPCEEELCPFRGKTWSEYQKHRKEHMVKLPCQTCKRQFNNSWFLRQHEFHRHTEGKRCFPCPKEGCAKTFTHRFNLDNHVLGDHEGKKAFSCAHRDCNRTFAMKESVWRHGVVHDPLKRKLKKLRPRKKPAWSAAQAKLQAAAETNKLSAKLCKTQIEDLKS